MVFKFINCDVGFIFFLFIVFSILFKNTVSSLPLEFLISLFLRPFLAISKNILPHSKSVLPLIIVFKPFFGASAYALRTSETFHLFMISDASSKLP